MTFNEILLQERKRKGLSQEELAGMVNISRQAVSKWETGDAMPDLPKLLALADALDISLDELCGRDTSATPAAEPAVPTKKGHFPVLGAVCTLLGLLLAGAVILLASLSAPAPAPSALSVLEDDFTVSGLNFSGRSGVAVAYRFTPNISGEGLSYQIIFTGFDGESYIIDAPCNSGVCSGEATLPSGYLSYGVTVRVTDGTISRNVAVAHSLEFSLGHASWTPIDPT